MVKGEGKTGFERLEVWQQSMKLTKDIYQLTRTFPKEEQYGLISQLQRAAVSIPANIAEGRGRFHKKEQVQFFYNARGSLYEVMTLLKLSVQLNYVTQHSHQETETLCLQILGKLSGLINSMKGHFPSPSTLDPTPSQ